MIDSQTRSEQAQQGLCHEALIYRGRQAFTDEVRAFVRAGRQAGEPVLVALPLENLELAQGALGDLNGSRAEIRFEEMSALAGNPSRLLSVYQDWIDDHRGPVRVVGEPVWPGRSYAETVECLRHEALMNHELASAQASILCPYDAERLEAATITGAEMTHPQLVGEGGVRRPSDGYGDPLDVGRGLRWPQPQAVEPISEHAFAGDLAWLRRAVAGDPIVHSLTDEQREDLVFVVNEAASNAVKHGDGTCTARLWNDGVCVVSEVSNSSFFDDAFAGRRRPSPHALSGRGLWLINEMCDLVEVRSGPETGTILRMHLRPRGG